MKKMIIKNSLVVAMAVFLLAVALPVVVSAQSARAQETQAAAQERKEMSQTTVTDKKEVAQTRLGDAKLKVCQNREKIITNIMTRMGDRGQKQVDLFTKIADKTQVFYTEKSKISSNYDALVSDLAAKKADAQAAVDKTKAVGVDFKCDGSDPKGVAASFKENMKAQNGALKIYKTAIKDLIIDVKSVQGATLSAGNSMGDEQ